MNLTVVLVMLLLVYLLDDSDVGFLITGFRKRK